MYTCEEKLIVGKKKYCEAIKACNWGDESQQDADCTDAPGVQEEDGKQMFCGQCYGQWCWEISERNKCY